MNDFIKTNIAIMDKYDPEKKVGIMVDEWGTWYAPTKGTDPGYLEQENSQRDAIIAALNFNIFARHADRVRGANIAQMINVLQAMILTDKEKMVLTPTYHAFRMYVPFQNAVRLKTHYEQGVYKEGDIQLPRIDAISARDNQGRIWLAITNIDLKQSADIDLTLLGKAIDSAEGEILQAPAIDATNTFAKPNLVAPKNLALKSANGKLKFTIAPQSVTVISVKTH